MSFANFKRAVQQQFATMQTLPLFYVDIDGEELWQLYLQSYPEGTNPIYRVQSEHDCSACRQFVKVAGKVVAIKEGKLLSIWDIEEASLATEYVVVARALSQAVKSKQISSRFVHDQQAIGVDKNFEKLISGQITAWEHFHITLPHKCKVQTKTIATIHGNWSTAYHTLTRAIQTITKDSIETVLDLIEQNAVYRGQEFKQIVQQFKEIHEQTSSIPEDKERNLQIWQHVWDYQATGVTNIRNSVIGTLLVDLSEGIELNSAVAKFEEKVAPANYKRPTALVTTAMVNRAKSKLQDMGLLSALERRHATARDIDINNVLWVGHTLKREVTGDIFESLATDKLPKLDRVQSISIEDFITDILPNATALEILVENRHVGNLISLIIASDKTAPNLFKWNNSFSWSYKGDVADSLRERVKRAGGNVDAELCCRLAWDYIDDLDFHMYEPDKGHIYYRQNRRYPSGCGGILDLDANGCDGMKDEPVENIFYQKIATMKQGSYKLIVRNFSRRSEGVGFEVEIDLMGTITSIIYDKVLRDAEQLNVAHIQKIGEKVIVTPLLETAGKSKYVWGIHTETFTPVKLVTLSPNYWNEAVGNKHYIFILEKCEAIESVRGFYNEFLRSELEPHRKVLEMVGSKVRTEPADSQLSGVGFSSTQRNSLTCRVKGSFNRIINITF